MEFEVSNSAAPAVFSRPLKNAHRVRERRSLSGHGPFVRGSREAGGGQRGDEQKRDGHVRMPWQFFNALFA